MNEAMQDMLESLPGLFNELMERPLIELVKGRLPTHDALYVFYIGDEPILVGSVPYVDELQLLAGSVRLKHNVHIRNYDSSEPPPLGPFRPRPLGGFNLEKRAPLKARWLEMPSPKRRMIFEVFAAQKLGLSVTHPELKRAITAPKTPLAADTRLPETVSGL